MPTDETLDEPDAPRELPRYLCHKEVRALKIAEVGPRSDLTHEEYYDVVPADEEFATFAVSKAYVVKHTPAAGGYYVVYSDGYESFSPAQAFEEGYTRI